MLSGSPRGKLTVLDLSRAVSRGEPSLSGPRMQLICGCWAQAGNSVDAVGILNGFGFKFQLPFEYLGASFLPSVVGLTFERPSGRGAAMTWVHSLPYSLDCGHCRGHWSHYNRIDSAASEWQGVVTAGLGDLSRQWHMTVWDLTVGPTLLAHPLQFH